jgi:hypothetical protein
MKPQVGAFSLLIGIQQVNRLWLDQEADLFR